MIPVFVIVRDRFEQLKATVEQLEKAEGIDIILLDNQSTYGPTVEWLEASHHKVIYLDANAGHHSPWIYGLVPPDGFYAVTDPDVRLIDECPADWPVVMVDLLQRFTDVNKVGVSLRIDNLPDHYYLKQNVIDWEKQFWTSLRTHIKDTVPIFNAAVDTTLAMYKGGSGPSIAPALRTGWPYVAEHLAWYVNSNALTEDEIYYRTHTNTSVASWRYSEAY